MAREVTRARRGWSGRDFESDSVLSGHLLLSCVLDGAAGVRYFRLLGGELAHAQFGSATENPRATEKVRSAIVRLQQHINKQAADQVARVYTLLKAIFKEPALDNNIVWNYFALLLDLNEIRVAAQQSRDRMSMDVQMQLSASEALLLNVAAVLLRFTRPLALPVASNSAQLNVEKRR